MSTSLWIIGIAFFASGLVIGIIGTYLTLASRLEEFVGWLLKDADSMKCIRECGRRRTVDQDQKLHLERIGKQAYDRAELKEIEKEQAAVEQSNIKAAESAVETEAASLPLEHYGE